MIRLIVLAVAAASLFGIISYEDDKVVIDTEIGRTIVEKSSAFIHENVEVK